MDQSKKSCTPKTIAEERAATVLLDYPIPSNWASNKPDWWLQQLQVQHTSTSSYFASNAHEYGHAGLAQKDDLSTSKVVSATVEDLRCSIKSTGEASVISEHCRAPKLIACGTDVTCHDFGDQSKKWTEAVSEFPYAWKENVTYTIATHAKPAAQDRVQYSNFFHAEDTGWKFLSTYEVNTDRQPWQLQELHSFVEHTSPGALGDIRAANFGPSFVTTGDNSALLQLPAAEFRHSVIETNDRVNAAAVGSFVGISTGGSTVSSDDSVSYDHIETSFRYPTTALSAVCAVLQHQMGCLQEATSNSDMDACIAS